MNVERAGKGQSETVMSLSRYTYRFHPRNWGLWCQIHYLLEYLWHQTECWTHQRLQERQDAVRTMVKCVVEMKEMELTTQTRAGVVVGIITAKAAKRRALLLRLLLLIVVLLPEAREEVRHLDGARLVMTLETRRATGGRLDRRKRCRAQNAHPLSVLMQSMSEVENDREVMWR